jgi:3-oxoacyl-[acyl-carrier protein] reductase
MDFKNKVTVITGGTRGIGRAITLAFLRHQAQVVALYHHNEATAQELAELAKIQKQDIQLKIMRCAVDKMAEVKNVMQAIKKEYGRIDILINNAGIYKASYLIMTDPSACDEIIDINLKGVIYTTKAASRFMMQQRQGKIVNIASLAGIEPFPGTAVYAASKAGVIAFSKVLAKELLPYGITVVCLAPGLVETEAILKMDEQARQEYQKMSDSTRILTAAEVAEYVLESADYAKATNPEDLIILRG